MHLMPTVCSTLYNRGHRNKQEEVLFSRNSSLRLTFIIFYTPTISFLFLMTLYLKMTVSIGYLTINIVMTYHLTVILPREGKSPDVAFCSVLLSKKRGVQPLFAQF